MIGNGAIRAAGRRRASGASAPAYEPDAVTFDGSNDYLYRAANLTGITDNKTGTFSVWVRPDTVSGDQRILCFDSTRALFRIKNTGFWNIYLKNTSGTVILNHSCTTTYITANEWHHFMFSFDMTSSSKFHVYINGVAEGTSVVTYTNGTIDWTQDTSISRRPSVNDQKLDGDMADLWFDNSYIDLSVQANREKFISGTGTGATPVNLGSDGSTPTASAPRLFMTGDASVWNAGTNSSGNGNFTVAGAVTDSTNEPVEI